MAGGCSLRSPSQLSCTNCLRHYFRVARRAAHRSRSQSHKLPSSASRRRLLYRRRLRHRGDTRRSLPPPLRPRRALRRATRQSCGRALHDRNRRRFHTPNRFGTYRSAAKVRVPDAAQARAAPAAVQGREAAERNRAVTLSSPIHMACATIQPPAARGSMLR